MGHAGRKTKLTDDLQKEFCNQLERAAFIEVAAASVGIRRQTVYNWMRRGARQKTGIYRRFLDAVKKAQAKAELTCIEGIEAAGRAGQWTARAWIAERRWPKRWGRGRLEHKSDEEKTAEQSPDEIAADLKALAAKLEKKHQPPTNGNGKH